MKQTAYWRLGILVLLAVSSLACGLLSVPAPVPASISTTVPAPTILPATRPVSTAIPTLTTTPDVTVPAVETSPAQAVSRPSAAPHFRPGDPVQVDLISMKSRIEGWALSGATVLTTVDGGQTWREATPPEDFPTGTDARAYGAFLDSHTAWIVFAVDGHIAPGASIWHTTDSGRNWTPGSPLNHQAIGDTVWAEFAVLDAKNVWVLVRGVYVGAGTHHNHELFHTTDGGLTWTSLDGQTSDDYTGIVFADTKFGLRTLQTTGAYAPAPPAYDVTTDGGAAWENRELPPPPNALSLFTQYPYCETYQSVLLSTRSIRMLVGCFDASYPPKQFASYFYSSQDGGTTWQTIRLPAKVQGWQAQLIYFGLNNALLLGRDEYLSTSDGQAWSPIKSVNWDGQFSFSDPQYGWAVARSNSAIALVNTIDGAATWKIIKPTIAQ